MTDTIDTRTYNYLEIIFTFAEHPQYIARFGNFNVSFFKSVLDFQAFIYQVLTDCPIEGVDGGSLPSALRKISCFQRTSVEGWDDVPWRYSTITREQVSEAEMPSWYGSGKWLYNDSATDYLAKQGVEPKFEHSTKVVREMKCIPDFDGWYAYHEFDTSDFTPYALDDDNLIFYGKFSDCPVLDAGNIALSPADFNTTTTESGQGQLLRQYLTTSRMILGDKALECLINGGTKEEAIELLREKEKAYAERKGNEWCDKAFDMAFRPILDEFEEAIEPEIVLPECPAGQDPYEVAMLECLAGNYKYNSAVEKRIKEHFDWEYIKGNKERWAEIGLFDDLPYTLEDGVEVNFNPAECDEPISYTELSPEQVRYADLGGGK